MRVTHLLPGYALDRACYDALDLPRDKFRAADFIRLEKGDTLPRYAARLAEAIGFQPGDAVGGLSLGGMLALEIARQCGASKVLLIGSCTHPRFLRPRYRAVARSVRLIPQAALHVFFSHVTMLNRHKGAYKGGDRDSVAAMLRRHPPDLLQKFPGLIMNWKGCEPGGFCAALHCDRDWLMAPPRHLANLTLIPGRSHLLTTARPEATRRFLMGETKRAE